MLTRNVGGLRATTRHYTPVDTRLHTYIDLRQPQILESSDFQMLAYATAHRAVTCHVQPPTPHWPCR
jgi:hypothetical protein